MNERTAYIDGSQIYGTSDEMMKSLRTMEDGLLVTQVRARKEEESMQLYKGSLNFGVNRYSSKK